MKIYNRQWLRDQLQTYLRDNQLSSVQDTLIDMAVKKIGVLAETEYNEITVTQTLTEDSLQLPLSINSFRAVVYNDYALKSVPVHMIETRRSNGTPQVYCQKGNSLIIAPFQAGDYQLTYFERLGLGQEDGDTNSLLQEYPFMYLDGVLAEGYSYKQDIQRTQLHEGKVMNALTTVNRLAAEKNAGDVPAMRAS